MSENNKNEYTHINIKKKIMFSRDEDYYFITYNLLIILNTLDCTSSKTKWTDYTKLIYLIPLVADSKLLATYIKYLKTNKSPSKEDYEVMKETYIKSRLKLNLITSIIFTLESEDLIGLIKNNKRHTIDIWLNKDKISKELLKSSLFDIEINNAKKLKTEIKRLKSLGIKTLLERLYTNNGVRVWDN
ncbi:hypothetical protein ACQ4XT_02770 [Halobacillus faecis]